MVMAIRRKQSVRHQDRQIGGHIQDATGNTAQDHFPEAAVAVGAHHQHVAAEFDCGAHQSFAHVLAIGRHVMADSRYPMTSQALGQTVWIRRSAEGWMISAENHDAACMVKQGHRRRHGSGGRPAAVPCDGDGRADRRRLGLGSEQKRRPEPNSTASTVDAPNAAVRFILGQHHQIGKACFLGNDVRRANRIPHASDTTSGWKLDSGFLQTLPRYGGGRIPRRSAGRLPSPGPARP